MRAIFGTFDRFTAFYIEETKGLFPLWLSPKQIEIIPVNSEIHSEYAHKVKDKLLENGFRVEVDDRNEKLGYRVREAQISKTPICLICGDNEAANNSVTIRRHGSQEQISIQVDELITKLKEEINNKKAIN